MSNQPTVIQWPSYTEVRYYTDGRKATRTTHRKTHGKPSQPKPVKRTLRGYRIFMAFIVGVSMIGGFYAVNHNTTTPRAHAEEPLMVSPLVDESYKKLIPAMEIEATPTATPVADDKKADQKEIEEYIRTIFGRAGQVAVAVSRNECSPRNAEYPGCVNHSSIEWSCGLFQINLMDPRTQKAVHAAKVPGATYEDKCNALKEPHMNTLVAFKIYTDWQSTFNAWSAFTNGNYLKDM